MLTFHTPLDDTTRHMAGEELFARLKPGAVVMNSSRGEVVDGDALLLRGRPCVLDVWEHDAAFAANALVPPEGDGDADKARNDFEGPCATTTATAGRIFSKSVVDCENIPIFAPLIHRYMLYGKLIKPLLFSLPPEQAHHIVTATLSLLGKVPGGRWLLHKLYATEDPSLEREVFGIRFKNPVGMAAGFDRYGHIYRELSAMGFGFVEVGSITPKRQPGNPKPRIFRLDAARALLNRVGICSHGLDRAVAHLRQPRGEAIVGCNIGKNTATPCDQTPADYLKCFRNLYQYADYFTINVACDPGQKAASYQTRENITKILEPLFDFRRGQNQYRPILLKVSPDLSDETIDLMTDIMLDTPLDGMVAVNATVSREGVNRLEATRIGAGVVSGQPLTQRALEVVRRIHTRSQGTYPIIGVGGLMTPDDVRAMLDAGAALVQIYTGYIYNGPGYVREICRALLEKKAAEN